MRTLATLFALAFTCLLAGCATDPGGIPPSHDVSDRSVPGGAANPIDFNFHDTHR